MGVVVYSDARKRPYDIADYQVRESVTPLVPGDGGQIPNLSFTARAIETGPLNKRNTAALSGSVRLDDKVNNGGRFIGRGIFLGKNASTRVAGGVVSVDADSALVAFNQEVKAAALISEAETVGSAFRYYAGLVGVAPHKIQVDAQYDAQSFVAPSWAGNAWEYIMDFCVAAGCELSMRSDIIWLHAPRVRTLLSENIEQPEVSTASPSVADRISVINYNTQRLRNRVVYTATGTYSVAAGGLVKEVIDYTNVDLSSINQPQAVRYTTPIGDGGNQGQYVVYDANNNVVSPRWWADSGGRLTVELGAEPGTLALSIVGAVGTEHDGPYTIGEYTDGNLNPGLYITGSGVFTNPEPVIVYTGSPLAQTEAEPETIDNIFFHSKNIAYSRGLAAATRAGGLDVTLSAYMPFDLTVRDGQEFGVVPGSRVQIKDNIFRITEVTYTSSGIDFSAKSDMLFNDVFNVYGDTFDEVNERYNGLTFDAYNDVWPVGTTFNYINSYRFPTFDDVEDIYEDISFLEQSVYPYIKAPIYDGIPLTFDDVDKEYSSLSFGQFDKSMPPYSTFHDLNRKLR